MPVIIWDNFVFKLLIHRISHLINTLLPLQLKQVLKIAIINMQSLTFMILMISMQQFSIKIA